MGALKNGALVQRRNVHVPVNHDIHELITLFCL